MEQRQETQSRDYTEDKRKNKDCNAESKGDVIEETRLKIAKGVRMRWKRKNENRELQETSYCEWRNLIAETARRGYSNEEELQWDSYYILAQKLRLERMERKEQRRVLRASSGNRRAPKSIEQRKKIAEAIAAKWTDPAYRERVCSGLAKYYGIPAGSERRLRKPRGNTEGRKRSSKKRTLSSSGGKHQVQEQIVRLQKQRKPVFKDPLANSKLEIIKNIRAKRVAEEAKKKEAVQRARVLIMEAEKAARVLEVAALRNPLAQASLLESRKLIAAAIHLN